MLRPQDCIILCVCAVHMLMYTSFLQSSRFRVPSSASPAAQDPNLLCLKRERLDKGCLDTYKAKRRDFYLYRAASKLWADGVPFDKALTVVTEAFNATTHEV